MNRIITSGRRFSARPLTLHSLMWRIVRIASPLKCVSRVRTSATPDVCNLRHIRRANIAWKSEIYARPYEIAARLRSRARARARG